MLSPDIQQTRRSTNKKCLDLLFIQDATGSQQPYIRAAANRCIEICYALQHGARLKEDGGLRVGVIAYRDHHEKEEFLTKDFGGFTSDVNTVMKQLGSITAAGGDDGPEAVAAAFDHALRLEWRDEASKVAILVTDAPPHGIGEEKDDYRRGSPGFHDILFLVRKMMRRGISLLVVTCEPTLSNDYTLAHDFYQAVAQMTCGRLLPLTDSVIIAPLVIGFAIEHSDLDTLAAEFEPYIKERRSEGHSREEICKELMEILKQRGQQVTKPITSLVFTEPPKASQYVQVWMEAEDLEEGREKLEGILKKRRIANVPPVTSWPKYEVNLYIKNTGNYYISVVYFDGLKQKSLTAVEGHIYPIKILVNVSYTFHFRLGSREVLREV